MNQTNTTDWFDSMINDHLPPQRNTHATIAIHPRATLARSRATNVKTPMSLVAALGLACAAPLGCVPNAEELALSDDDPISEDEAPRSPLGGEGFDIGALPDTQDLDGSVTTGWWEIVRIQNSFGDTCTATAVAHDVLVTALQCIRPSTGNAAADWVEIINATGGNAGTVGARSSYFMMSEDRWSSIFPFDPSLSYNRARDIAFIKFGADTFEWAYPLDDIEDYMEMARWMRVCSYGDNDTKTQGWVLPEYYVWEGEFDYLQIAAAQNNTTLEPADVGSPLFSNVNGQVRIHGVMSSVSGGKAYYSLFNKEVHDHVSLMIDTVLPASCAEAYADPNYSGASVSFCDVNWATSAMSFDTNLEDTFGVRRRAHPSYLQGELSSVLLSDDMTLGLTDGTHNQTFQTTIDEISTPSIPNLGDYGFDDAATAVTHQRSTDDVERVHLELQDTGLCMTLEANPQMSTVGITQSFCDPHDTAQIFDIVRAGAYYEVRHPSSGKCMKVPSVESGIPVVVQDCGMGTKNTWILDDVPGTSDARDFTLKFNVSGHDLCMVSDDPGPVVIMGAPTIDPPPLVELGGCNPNSQSQQIVLRAYPDTDPTVAGFCDAYDGHIVTIRDQHGDYLRNATTNATVATDTGDTANHRYEVSCVDGNQRAVFRNTATYRYLMAGTSNSVWSSSNIYGSNKFEPRGIGNRWRLHTIYDRYVGNTMQPTVADGIDSKIVEQVEDLDAGTNWLVSIVD